MEYEREDPPPAQIGAGHWKDAGDAAKRQPGVWLVASRTSSSNNAGGVVKDYKLRGFDSTQRRNGDGTSTVYVRWPAS